ncbi:hypothetical protein [Psychrobacter sp. DAB_AL62B]|uniref:hypothetical protein n=1 Tax=Psychrobacter sp. DAB_AL62B TaxID=1028420 RepID=UPI00238128F9|nr:hypothetical protein [Psychrobacter sp. DAB_AL62B]MDE4453694.1 hypothetical protein [Psychrobacter sp. DAB_AL62B]
MRQNQHFSNSIASQILDGYICRIAILMSFIALLLASTSSFAASKSDMCTGVKGSLTSTDYKNLLTAYNSNSAATISGSDIPLKIKMTKVESSSSNTTSNFSDILNGQALNITHTLANKNAHTDIKFDFINSNSDAPIYLTNVALSAFDIDTFTGTPNSTSNFDDLVIVAGTGVNNTLITGQTQFPSISDLETSPYTGTGFPATNGSRMKSELKGCQNQNLDARCQASINFDQPVSSVTIRYASSTRLGTREPTEQQIDIRLDSYCYVPPKLTIKKILDGSRVNDTNTDRDQFEISVAGGSIAANSFTTTGTGNAIATGTSAVLELKEATTYTITEKVINTSGKGDIAAYNASYICTNSTTVLPTANMIYNNSQKTRSFTLADVKFGDFITCTITNMPKPYTFTGYVFNDNGGIAENSNTDINTNTKSDISSTFTSNPKYFNAIFDQGESGISATGMTVSLTNCDGLNITGTTAQVVGVEGQYKFTVPGNVISSLAPQKVCLVQNEPSGWEFSVDTTPNIREVALVNNIFDYKTESDGSRNLDFGEVKANYSALVLIKSQYVHDCNDSRTFIDMPQNPQPDLPTNGFSTNGITGIVPGQCIAYRIEAYNRGHVALKDIQITDKLQNKLDGKPVTSSFTMPLPKGVPSALYDTKTLPSGTITSNMFNLDKPAGIIPTKATLYFNTKYGTTVDP